MYCSNCGSTLQEGANFCAKCGTPSAASKPAQASIPAGTQEPGHGALILVLGLLSLVMLGPFTGIPAWVMGVRDLKKIREGKIPASEQTMTQIGMVLGIVGTVLGAIALAIIAISLLIVFGILSTVAGEYHESAGAFLVLLPSFWTGRRVRS
jgi:hypothetical protein